MVGKKQEERWQKCLKALKAYKKKHGDCLVTQYDKHNVKLGYWVSNQRQEYKKWLKGISSRLTQERIDQLNEIDFVWDARFERKSKESNKSIQESPIPSLRRRNVTPVTRKRRIPSKDRPKKRRRRQQLHYVNRELSPSERKERRRLMLEALKTWRNPM